VSFNGWIYGIPQTLGPVDLSQEDVAARPGVVRDSSEEVVEREILAQVTARISEPASHGLARLA
jgi:hypothetical protein